MNSNMQPNSQRFGDPLGQAPYVGCIALLETLPPHIRDFVLLQMEKGGLESGYHKAFNFGAKERHAHEIKKRRMLEEYWQRILIELQKGYESLFRHVTHLVLHAEGMVEELHEQISDQIEEIDRMEDTLDGVNSPFARRMQASLRAQREGLSEQHDELHEYERDVLRPIRNGLTSRRLPSYKQLLKFAGDLAVVPKRLFNGFHAGIAAASTYAENMRSSIEDTFAYEEPTNTNWETAEAYYEPEPV